MNLIRTGGALLAVTDHRDCLNLEMTVKRIIMIFVSLLLSISPITSVLAQPARALILSSRVTAPALASTAPASGNTRHDLSKTDADAWLDGFLPYALQQADIAGAAVVIVKDGQVLTARGFGYADVAARKAVDPDLTLFRPGSVSKLFTWTAVMQLVEQGKIDLDADVNRYLDFKIPPFRGRPITMRDLMTHTPGFGDVFKDGIRSTGDVPPLGAVLRRMLPDRIFAPGTTPAYSNYGCALAGYIVERVSGMPFNIYVEHNIFWPLGMAHSTFRQPLPPKLAPFMSKGYVIASQSPQPFELVSIPPAGGLSASASDMAKFMMALLNHGAGLMRPETARQMLAPTNVVLPGLNRMALGFYEQQVNGLSAVGHAGDLNRAHAYLWLLPAQNTGVFVVMNSAGATESESFDIRLGLFQAFGDRYFPVPARAPLELSTAKAHAKLLVGNYSLSRGSFTNFIDAANFLRQTHIGLDEDGRPQVPYDFSSRPHKWIEIAPFLWQDAYGPQRLSAKVENGKVVRWSVDAVSPFMVWEPTPWTRNIAWLMPAFLAGLGIIAITALGWPAGAIARRRYGASLGLTGIDLTLHRLIHGLSWLALAILGGWMLLFQSLGATDASLDAWIWLLEITSAIGFAGLAACALWIAYRSWTRPGTWFARAWPTLRAAAALSILWVAVAFHLTSFGANY
ncbi:serine hydrolase domain-containing protein [Sphingobium sp.]|uniref:serine hydrolase domain-containing protein n=1 Tax=Sphingobium sp. TaxID=1912891 RepID=UPI0028BE829E|nr:serine hydrolase domain-containing protein [Sphingobium sp.]